MTDKMNLDSVGFFRDYNLVKGKLSAAIAQLSTGKRYEGPKEVTDFERVSRLQLDQTGDRAKMKVFQRQMSWLQSSMGFLGQINDTLSRMSELTIQGQNTAIATDDRGVHDSNFQKYKEELSTVIDGLGGTSGASALFNSLPLFTGHAVTSNIGVDGESVPVSTPALNLYTGYQNPGFSSLDLQPVNGQGVTPSVSGTAQAGTATTITLDIEASAIENAYQTLQITITGGTGAGQTNTIDAYNGVTGVATVASAWTTPPDATSTYRIDASQENEHLQAIGNVSSIRVAEWVWGADNDRSLDQAETSFRALTEDERNYRTANAIPDTDLEAKTYAEKMERRKQNIFDPEFGRLDTLGRAKTMSKQVSQAINKVSQLIVHLGGVAEALRGQVDLTIAVGISQNADIDQTQNTDIAQSSASMNELSISFEEIMQLAARLSENKGKLNDLVRNKGGR
jgi:flagellin-like hook-associated protein FlgL